MGLPERYTAVPRVLCFITHGDEVLLLRGAPDKRIWPNRTNGIGGHVERGEDVYTAARREIAEETGLAVHDLRLRGVVNVAPDDEGPGVMLFVFTARALERETRASSEGALLWVQPSHLEEPDLVEDLPVLLSRALTMAPTAPPFFAHSARDEAGRSVVVFAESEGKTRGRGDTETR